MNQAACFKGPIDDISCDKDASSGANLTLACQLQPYSKWAAWVGNVWNSSPSRQTSNCCHFLLTFSLLVPAGQFGSLV